LRINVVGCDAPRSFIDISGELDLATAEQLNDALHRELALDHRFTRLDVSKLGFCDAAGLGVLLRAHHEYAAAHGSLALSGVGPRLAWLLRITALDAVLNVASAGSTSAPEALPSRERM
jgi:anti-sigma B factor antagonist